MATETLSKIEKLKAQQAKIAAQIQYIEAREKTTERKQETRRKILVGSYYLDKARSNQQFEDLQKSMNGYLKRNSDRKLFGLPELTE